MAETKRTVQDVFDDERRNRNRIEEIEEELEMINDLKTELKECKEKKKCIKNRERNS